MTTGKKWKMEFHLDECCIKNHQQKILNKLLHTPQDPALFGCGTRKSTVQKNAARFVTKDYTFINDKTSLYRFEKKRRRAGGGGDGYQWTKRGCKSQHSVWELTSIYH